MSVQPTADLALGDELAPSFDVVIEGASKSSEVLFEALRPLIAGVTYEEDEEMAGMFELTVVGQPDDVDWKAVIDCKAFQEGNPVDLFMGYAGLKRCMGRVEIVKWLPKGGAQGITTFMIKGYDGRHRMMIGNQFKAKKPKEESQQTKSSNRKDASRKAAKTRRRNKRGGGSAKGKKGQKQKQRHVYTSMTDDQIVTKVAAKYGFLSDCDSTDKSLQRKTSGGGGKDTLYGGGTSVAKPGQTIAGVGKLPGGGGVTRRSTSLPSRVQTSDQTDWQFLQRLAAINRFDLWVDFDYDQDQWCVHFKRRKDVGDPEYTFTYNGRDGSLLEWEVDFAITDQSTSIEVLYFDRKRREISLTSIEETEQEEDVRFTTASPGDFTVKTSIGKGARVRFTAFGQTLEAFANRPFRSRADAESFVKDWLKERERDFLILKAKVIGVETLRPRQVHEFTGMSKRCDGVYRLTQAKHAMQPGNPYVVELVAHKVLSQEVSRRKPTTKAKVTASSSGRQVVSGGGQFIGGKQV